MTDDIAKMLLTDSRSADQKYKALQAEYGSSLVIAAQQDVIIGLLISAGVISKDNFVDLLGEMLKHHDMQRMKAAGQA